MFEHILEKAQKKADKAEVFTVGTESLEVSFEAGVLKSAERKKRSGAALRVIHEGRLGFSSTTDPERGDDLVEAALAAARCGKEADFDLPAAESFPAVDSYDSAVADFAPETAVEEGRRAVDALAELYPKGLAYVSFSSAVSTVHIANSSGFEDSYRATNFSQGMLLTVVDGDSILWIDDGHTSSRLRLETDSYAAVIADLALKAEKKAPKVAEALPVIFPAKQMANLTPCIEMAVDGLSMLKGESPLIGRIGDKVLGSITVIDDPLIAYGVGSRPFDDEGVVSQKNILFEDGVFRNFLFDIDTAAAADETSTGSASRSSLAQPSIGMSNLVMSTGGSSLEEMIAETKHGAIMYNVIGAGQSNMMAGDFAMNVGLGFMIENGEITGRLSDTMLSGNIYDVFDVIESSGSEAVQVGAQYLPDTKFSKIAVSGA